MHRRGKQRIDVYSKYFRQDYWHPFQGEDIKRESGDKDYIIDDVGVIDFVESFSFFSSINGGESEDISEDSLCFKN